MGDGEQQEGSVWEAAMEAAHFDLDNLVAIVDYNGLQIDGPVCDVMNIDPIEEKYHAFGWDVLHINGQDMEQVVPALERGKRNHTGKPLCIIAQTVKGKGVSFMENKVEWHYRNPTPELLAHAIAEIDGADHA